MKKWVVFFVWQLLFFPAVLKSAAQGVPVMLTEQEFKDHYVDATATDLESYTAEDSSEFQTVPAGPGIVCHQWKRGHGLDATGAKNGYNSRVFKTTLENGPVSAALEGKYLYFSIAVEEGYTLTVDELTWLFKRSDTGPSHFQWQYRLESNGSGFTDLGVEQIFSGDGEKTVLISFSPPLVVTNDVLTFRILAWGASSDLGTFRIINGTRLNATVLPLDLLSFTATTLAHEVQLHWATANEIQVKGFELEQSTDAIHFQSIRFIPAKNERSNSYLLSVPPPPIRTFYRLKLMDLDGSFRYSPVQSVSGLASLPAVILTPNPTHGQLRLLNLAPGSAIRLFSMQGNEIIPVVSQQSETHCDLDVSGLPAGHYQLNIHTAAGVAIRNFIRR